MVRVLHIADLHIGVENYGHFDVTRGMHTRLIDFLARLDEAIDIGITSGVDLVLIAGDMFKTATHHRGYNANSPSGFGACTSTKSPC